MPSLFKQTLESVAFLTYFLGAIVPLTALAILSGSAAPRLLKDVTVSWTGFLLAAAVLSLASFLALRRVMQQVSRQRRQDHERFLALLNASWTMTSLSDMQEAAGVTAQQAVELVGARSAVVFWRDKQDSTLRVLGLAGQTDFLDDADLVRQLRISALEAVIAKRVMVRLPGMPCREGGKWTIAAAALPLRGENVGEGSLAVLHASAEDPFPPGELDALSMLANVASSALAAARMRESVAPVPATV